MTVTVSLNPWSVENKLLTGELDMRGFVQQAAQLGYDAVDIGESWMGLSPDPDLVRLRGIRSDVRQEGLTVSSCWFWADLLQAITLSGSIERAMGHVERYFGIAEFLSAPVITIQNGLVPPGQTASAARTTLLEAYESLDALAQRYGVHVGFETARVTADFNSPQGALDLVREFGSPWLTVTPDFEAWRRPRPGMPALSYPEIPGVTRDEPLDPRVFRDSLPHAPLIHAKFLEIDETGTEPNMPIRELFAALRESPADHVLCVEYEGWIPDLFPERDSLEESGKVRQLIAAELRA